MSAIGPAIEEFGPFSHVEKRDGTVIEVAEWLLLIQEVVAEFTLERVLDRSLVALIDPATRFYLLGRWIYGQGTVPFDEANKLARSLGTELAPLMKGNGIVMQKGSQVQLMGPKERNQRKTNFGMGSDVSIIDVLHQACIFWEDNKREALTDLLMKHSFNQEIFWQVSQCLDEFLPPGNKEKQLFQGLLMARLGLEGKLRLHSMELMEKAAAQEKMDLK
jgi:hypothetical protein